jgi:dipeptidase
MKSKVSRVCVVGLLTTLVLALLALGPVSLSPVESESPSAVDTAYTVNEDKLEGCSAFVAGKDASVDGYTMSGHTCDGNCDWHLRVIPAEKHRPLQGPNRAMYVIDYTGLPGGFQHDVTGEIPQVAETHKYFFLECPFANEFQVFWGENTCSTRSELYELTWEEALIDWTQTSALALQRGRTARETIQVLGELIEEYGLNGSGESYLISDPDEVWVMEIAGLSYQWVAARIPDDHVSPHANRFRICEVDLSDSDWFMGSPRLIELPIERGVYDPADPFCFEEVYSSSGSRESMGNRLREWRMFSLIAPSGGWDPNALVYPLSVEPDELVSVQDMMAMFRDYYEGTDYDQTQGIAAGPFGCPERPSIRGIRWDRAIGIPRTSYFWVSQARDSLPDPIGGVAWFGFDAPYSSVVVPFYVGITTTPESWRTGDFTKFSEDSARWYFQAMDNYSCLRFNEMNAEVRAAFDAIEADQFASQEAIEQEALGLYETNPHLAEKFLTDYSTQRALEAEAAARDLYFTLLAKYADGSPRTTVSDEWMDLLQPTPVP